MNKKIISLILCLFIVIVGFSLIGCNKNSNNNSNIQEEEKLFVDFTDEEFDIWNYYHSEAITPGDQKYIKKTASQFKISEEETDKIIRKVYNTTPSKKEFEITEEYSNLRSALITEDYSEEAMLK